MSQTINLILSLLARGRKLQRLGLYQEALGILTSLSRLKDLPPVVAEETHRRLAEIHLRRRKYARARHHLAAALSRQPANSHYHYLMGGALAADRKADPQQAAACYRRCLELDPQQPSYLCDFGLSALSLGQREEGLQSLRQAYKLAPDNPGIVRKVAAGLRQEGLIEEARTLLRTAQFRNPRDYRFQKLWTDFQFQVLYDQQHNASSQPGNSTDQSPTILPFVLPEPMAKPTRLTRRDAAARPNAPHLPQSANMPNRKQA